MSERISTIIPIYNCKDKFPAMLESILSGTIVPSEIFLVDDGSTDGSFELAQIYAEKHASVTALSQEHSGVSAARSLGLSYATGDWISFLDGDDYIEPDMYEIMLESIEKADEKSAIDGCICGYYTHKDGVVTPYFHEESAVWASNDILKAMFTDECTKGFLCTRLFSAKLIRKITFYPGIRVCEDLLSQTRLYSENVVNFAVIAKPLYHYIQNEGSATITRNYFENNTFIYKPAFDLIHKYVNESYIEESYNDILEYSMYSLLKQYAGRKKASKDPTLVEQIHLLKKELRNTKCPYNQKSKRRIAYEHYPLIISHFI